MTQPVGFDKFDSDNTSPKIDWEKVAENVKTPKSTIVQTGKLSLRSYILLLAASAAANDSLRQKSKSVLDAQVKRWDSECFQDIIFYAKNKGLTIEDAIIELVNNGD